MYTKLINIYEITPITTTKLALKSQIMTIRMRGSVEVVS